MWARPIRDTWEQCLFQKIEDRRNLPAALGITGIERCRVDVGHRKRQHPRSILVLPTQRSHGQVENARVAREQLRHRITARPHASSTSSSGLWREQVIHHAHALTLVPVIFRKPENHDASPSAGSSWLLLGNATTANARSTLRRAVEISSRSWGEAARMAVDISSSERAASVNAAAVSCRRAVSRSVASDRPSARATM